MCIIFAMPCVPAAPGLPSLTRPVTSLTTHNNLYTHRTIAGDQRAGDGGGFGAETSGQEGPLVDGIGIVAYGQSEASPAWQALAAIYGVTSTCSIGMWWCLGAEVARHGY